MRLPDRAVLKRMTRALAHRGPDDERLWLEPGVGLGHRRLRVIAPQRAAQPIQDRGRGTCLVFNGAIYNFKQLALELCSKGHPVPPWSDAEALLYALVEWWSAALDRLNGMFALAAWDAKNRRLLLARDRLGQKPLYYARIPNGLIFASELKALLEHPDFESRLDLDSLRRYLIFEYVPQSDCILQGVAKVGPGTFVEVDAETMAVRAHRYWSLPLRKHPVASGPVVSLAEASEELEHLLRQAARRQLLADVPVGLFLSGGLDSGSLAALLGEREPRPARRPGSSRCPRNPNRENRGTGGHVPGQGGAPIRTFTLGFGDQSYDESLAAARIAHHVGSEHRHEVFPESRLVELVKSLGAVLDEPLGDPSLLPTVALSSFARRHVTVALAGDGGDELFAGYPTFQAEGAGAILSRRCVRGVVPLLRAVASKLPVSHGNISFDFKLNQFVRGLGFSPLARHQLWLGSFSPREVKELLNPDVLQALGPFDPLEEMTRRVGASHHMGPSAVGGLRGNPGDNPGDGGPVQRLGSSIGNGDLDQLLAFYCTYYLAGDILPKSDVAGMAVGLEVRAPFLDPEVISFACALPAVQRYRHGETKVVLRHLARRLLPLDIASKPKKGFGIPIGRWLRGPLRPLMEELLSPSSLGMAGLFRPAVVRRLVDEHVVGRANHRKKLWTLMVYQLWSRRVLGC